ncbi:MAG: hypothetical protein H0V60_04920 [Actinobacteria bacterium]|nr:hypothetical protein [Actinomycetota bacterium]
MTLKRPERRCNQLAARQYGLIARRQALALGMPGDAIDRRLTAHAWLRFHPGVYRMPGTPQSWEQALLALCLRGGRGTAACGRSAASLHQLPGFNKDVVEIATPRRLRSVPAGIILHRATVPDADQVAIKRIPVTGINRTLIDLAGVAAREALELALDSALYRRTTTVSRLRRRMDEIGCRGRPGTAMLRELLNARPPDVAIAESPLETRIIALLADNGLPSPVVQFDVYDHGAFLGRVDLAYPGAKVAIEVDGYAYHHGRAVWQHDRDRRNALTGAGWDILHATSESEAGLIAQLRRLLGL